VSCPDFSRTLTNSRRFHAVLMFFFCLIALREFAIADPPKAKPLPCGLTEAEVAGLNGDASTDVQAVPNYIKTIYGILRAGKFGQLDCLADTARSQKEMFSGGMWKLHAIYLGLARPPLHPTQEDWEAHIVSVQRWVTTSPESITARIALAESYVSYGEDARGPGYSDTVSESGWRLLAERLGKAKQILEQASALSTKDPEWFAAMQELVLHQGWEQSARQDLLERAVKFEPKYYYYYRLYANSILPKWGGEDGEVARFLKHATDQVGGEAGDILYFQVAGKLVCGCQDDQHLNLSWPRIQKGFAAVEKQNGPSLENWNLLAHMAVSFDDGWIADKMFDRIGEQWSEDVWQTSSYFESMKQWAKRVGPMLAKRHDAEESAETNLHTAEGQRYNAAFGTKFQTWMQPCVEEVANKDLRDFELLLKVGNEGTIEDMTGGGNISLLTKCLAKKLMDIQVGKKMFLPQPPQPNYWVRFDFAPEQELPPH
jgi:hypothetical protein